MKTFESIYLTNEVVGLDRFTITFKSVQNGLTYYHTVLGQARVPAVPLTNSGTSFLNGLWNPEIEILASMICRQ